MGFSDLSADKHRRRSEARFKAKQRNAMTKSVSRTKKIGEANASLPSYDAMNNSQSLENFFDLDGGNN